MSTILDFADLKLDIINFRSTSFDENHSFVTNTNTRTDQNPIFQRKLKHPTQYPFLVIKKKGEKKESTTGKIFVSMKGIFSTKK